MKRRSVRIDSPSRSFLLLLIAGLGALLAWTMVTLPAPALRLAERVDVELGNSGVSHAVTAVLLNFRGYDTLLEIGVLILAVLGVLATEPRPEKLGAARDPRAEAVLSTLTHLVVPVMILVAGYLLWSGAHRPGGAFQAGAVLAAAGVLLRLSGRLPVLLPPARAVRVGALFGFAVFLAVSVGTLFTRGALLAYPPAYAGALILLIEAALMLSIGVILVALFVGAPAPRAGKDERI